MINHLTNDIYEIEIVFKNILSKIIVKKYIFDDSEVKYINNVITNLNQDDFIVENILEVFRIKDYFCIRIKGFIKGLTYIYLKQVLEKVKSNHKVILDLRMSAGGDISETLECLSLFNEENYEMNCKIKYINSESTLKVLSSKQPVNVDCILIDKYTFSSSAYIFVRYFDEMKCLIIGDETINTNNVVKILCIKNYILLYLLEFLLIKTIEF